MPRGGRIGARFLDEHLVIKKTNLFGPHQVLGPVCKGAVIDQVAQHIDAFPQEDVHLVALDLPRHELAEERLLTDRGLQALLHHRDPVGVQGLAQHDHAVFVIALDFLGGQLARQVETGLEQTHQFLGDVGMVNQGAGDIAEVKAQANLLEVTGIGAQQRHVTPRHRRGQHQAVEGIVLGLTFDDVDEGILQGVVELLDVQVQAFGGGEREIVDPELATIGVTQAVRELTQHAQTQVFQDRQDIGQCQRGISVIQLAMQFALTGHLTQWLVETHHQRVFLVQAQQVLHVDHGRMRGETLAIASRETLWIVRQHVGAVGFAEAFDGQGGVIVLPAAAGLDHFVFQLLRIDVDAVFRVHTQDQLHAG